MNALQPRCAYQWQTSDGDKTWFHVCTQPPLHDPPHECGGTMPDGTACAATTT